jgi:hypothetical protein
MDEDDIANDPVFLAWVNMREFLEDLAQHMREEARVAEEAAQRLAPGR